MDQVTVMVDDIRLRGRCGITAEERAVGQTLVVDLAMEPRECPGVETDDLSDTVDYGLAVDIVREVVEGSEFNLLERLATVIADRLWETFALRALAVTVAKLAPPTPVPARAARVTVRRA